MVVEGKLDRLSSHEIEKLSHDCVNHKSSMHTLHCKVSVHRWCTAGFDKQCYPACI